MGQKRTVVAKSNNETALIIGRRSKTEPVRAIRFTIRTNDRDDWTTNFRNRKGEPCLRFGFGPRCQQNQGFSGLSFAEPHDNLTTKADRLFCSMFDKTPPAGWTIESCNTDF